MADKHGAAYNHSPEVDANSGNLPWNETDDYGGYGSEMTCPPASHNDGDNDTDDIGTYMPIPAVDAQVGNTSRFTQTRSDSTWS